GSVHLNVRAKSEHHIFLHKDKTLFTRHSYIFILQTKDTMVNKVTDWGVWSAAYLIQTAVRCYHECQSWRMENTSRVKPHF
ncbi:hypothetical protein ATANTOWER_020522, partial [Ataeniobius toweri]|nr:hypothetical protein [Ataeniobius toweri]